MKRAWFRDKDGTYYRNINLISDELNRSIWRPLHYRRLLAEWDVAWRRGLIRKERLGRSDVEVKPRPFREAYPNHPILWTLDER